MDWINFTQQLINGLALGSVYALIALGYTMVYGVLRFINFAHGDIFMIGAFVSLIALLLLGAGMGLEGPAALLLHRRLEAFPVDGKAPVFQLRHILRHACLLAAYSAAALPFAACELWSMSM